LTRFSSVAKSLERADAVYRSDSGATALLNGLRSTHAQEAWQDFLLQFGDTLYQVAGISTRNEEEAADCFVFVCEKLAENAYRRLLCFKPAGTASFSTWLRVVAKNLCFDWQRKVHGRPRPFKSLRGLGRWIWRSITGAMRGGCPLKTLFSFFVPPGPLSRPVPSANRKTGCANGFNRVPGTSHVRKCPRS
jgi:DNA-directed RNA polymerase specialized sigma subunit, sigma24 homolog